MLYEISKAIASHILWFLLLAWVGFRYFRYSAFVVPRKPTVSRKDYEAWREWESAPLVLTVAVTTLSILFALFYKGKTIEDRVVIGTARSAILLLMAAGVITLQKLSLKKAKKIGMFRKGPPPLPTGTLPTQ